jgi:hypothetical protein
VARLLGIAIGIEEYDEPETLPPITGAMTQAKAFRDLLVEAGAAEAHAFLCTSPAVPGHHDASRLSLAKAFTALAAACGTGADADGDTVLIYISAHGCQKVDRDLGDEGEDLLLPANYSRFDPAQAIRLPPLWRRLAAATGPGDHVWFVDECRNTVPVEGSTFADLTATGRKRPRLHRLFATQPGTTAPIAGPFSQTLMSALRGEGRAKERSDGEYWVRFRSLSEFVAAAAGAIGRTVEHQTDGEPDRIRRIDDVPRVAVTVIVHGAPSDSRGTLQVDQPVQQYDLDAPQATVLLEPDDYFPSLIWGRTFCPKPSNSSTGRVDCYAPTTIEFDLRVPRDFALEAGIPDFETAANSRVMIDRPHSNQRSLGFDRLPGSGSAQVLSIDLNRPELLTTRGALNLYDHGVPIPIPAERLELVGGDGRRVAVEMLLPRRSELNQAILQAAPTSAPDGAVPLTALIADAVDDDGLILSDDATMLSVLGAAAILDRHPYEEVVDPLPGFDELTGDTAGLLVLVAGERTGSVAVDGGEPIAFGVAGHGSGRTSFACAVVPPGALRIALDIHGFNQTTFQTVAVGGRVTLAVVTGAGPRRIRQYCLPVGHLRGAGTDSARALRDVHFSAFVQQRYASAAPLGDAGLQGEAATRFAQLQAGDWIDPITICVAAWDLARAGGAEPHADVIRAIDERLNSDYPESAWPDLAVLVALADGNAPRETESPMLLDAAIARADTAPDPPGCVLDFTGPWTAWKRW